MARSTKVSTSAGPIRIAVAADLVRLKKIAYADRKKATDAQDLEFLRTLTKTGAKDVGRPPIGRPNR